MKIRLTVDIEVPKDKTDFQIRRTMDVIEERVADMIFPFDGNPLVTVTLLEKGGDQDGR